VTTSSAFAVAKLVPLAVFVVAGLFVMGTDGGLPASQPAVRTGSGTWLEAILLLVFAYGGFESALLPLSEAKDPRRDAPVALFAALGLCALLYTLVQVVVIAALADPGASARPLAAAAQVFLGPVGAWLMAAGALVSVYGYLAAAMLNVPRLTYAMATEGDLPATLGAVHPRFRTPHVSVLLFAATVWTLAAAGDFLQNLTLSAVSRLLTYGAVSVALLVLRRREYAGQAGVEAAWFRVPGGLTVAALGLAFSAVLALRMSRREVAVLAVTLLAGLLHWLWMRARTEEASRP
jgi:amino acid transporter